MLPKPRHNTNGTEGSGCEGCPLYGDGRGFVPDDLSPDLKSTVFVLGQNPGQEEENSGRPFVGKTGEMLLNEFFPRAGLVRGENAICGNTIKCRWIKDGKRTNDLPPDKMLRVAVAHCTQAHLNIPKHIRLVAACGALAWKALGGKGTISEWRGFLKC